MRQPFIERIELQPIDPQTNGPQLLYGLSYVTRIVKPDAPETYHHQIGYWLWEPATETVDADPGHSAGAGRYGLGHAPVDAVQFELTAQRGSTTFGICSSPFLEYGFRTISYRITVTVHPDGTWSYDELTLLMIRGQSTPFEHIDRNTLTRVADPTPNPLMRV